MMGQAIGCFAGDDNGENRAVYLVPNDANTVVHVNATDLNVGTANVGPAWTEVGTVPYNSAGTPRASVGPFSSSNYFSLPTGAGSANITGTFSIAIIFNTSASDGDLWVNANFETADSGLLGYIAAQGHAALITSNSIISGTTNVFVGGLDTSMTTLYAMLNGGTLASNNAVGHGTSDSGSNIGGGPLTSFGAINGYIYEVWISTTTPTPTNLTALYNSIIANI